jgi:hypothetical protein
MMSDVHVRMYRRILGDCFLIRTVHDGKPWHALIDFGVLQGSPGRAESTAAIVADIGRVTGHKLDLLVVTHEHADHISGFAQERARFFAPAGPDVFDIGETWLAWTEKLTDPQAAEMHATRRVAGNAVALAAQFAPLAIGRLGEAVAGLDSRETAARREAETLAGLARFVTERDDFGEAAPGDPALPDDDQLGLDIDLSGRFTGARVMTALRQMPNLHYLEPGEQRAAGPFTAHVLGPPRGANWLSQSDPRRGEGREVYLTQPDRARALATEVLRRFEMMGVGMPAGRSVSADAASPFAARHRRPIAEAFAGKDPVAAEYVDAKNGWRQITGAFLNAASELALQLDSDTNNTSLALALALPDGQVLLFPADAQVGNWLSWGEKRDAEGKVSQFDIAGILSRVTLYKVGHHASHNATLRDRGLELMTDPRLSAMIPVDRDVARSQEWQFPYPPLETRLLEKTGGRLVMGDGDAAAEAAAFAGSGHARVAHDPGGLWVEVIVPVSGGAAALPPAKPRRRRSRKPPAN